MAEAFMFTVMIAALLGGTALLLLLLAVVAVYVDVSTWIHRHVVTMYQRCTHVCRRINDWRNK